MKRFSLAKRWQRRIAFAEMSLEKLLHIHSVYEQDGDSAPRTHALLDKEWITIQADVAWVMEHPINKTAAQLCIDFAVVGDVIIHCLPPRQCFSWAESLFQHAQFHCAEDYADSPGERPIQQYVAVMSNLAHLYQCTGRYVEARRLSEHAVETYVGALGEDDPDYVHGLKKLEMQSNGSEYLRERYAMAERLYQQGLDNLHTLAEDHPDYAQQLNDLAGLCHLMGRFTEAERLYQQALERFSEDHPDYIRCLENLAAVYTQRGRYEEAKPLVEKAVEIVRTAAEMERATYGKEALDYIECLLDQARAHMKGGRYEEAESLNEKAAELLRNADEKLRTALGDDHPE